MDSFTGTKMTRPEFDKLLEKLKAGDTLVVAKLDRFARSVSQASDLITKLIDEGIRVDVCNLGILDNSSMSTLMRVFCNHFLYKVAKSFCRSLHLHFVGNCKGTCQAFRPDRNALQTLFNCYSTRYGNGSSEFSSSCACSLKYWKSSSSFW